MTDRTPSRRMTLLLVASLGLNALILLGAVFFVHRKGGVPYLRGKYHEVVLGQRGGGPGYTVWEWDGYRQRTSVYALAPVQPGDVVFLGDSHVEYAAWPEIFGTSRVKNRGLAGDVTGGVLRRLDEVIAGRPAAVLLSIGSNDVDAGLGGATVEATLENVARILDTLRAATPGTAVYLLSALPKSARSTLNATETPLALRLNTAFAELAPAHGATYIDIAAPMQESDGSLQPELTNDGAHLNGNGYRRFVDTVRPVVERHLSDVP